MLHKAFQYTFVSYYSNAFIIIKEMKNKNIFANSSIKTYFAY